MRKAGDAGFMTEAGLRTIALIALTARWRISYAISGVSTRFGARENFSVCSQHEILELRNGRLQARLPISLRAAGL